MSAAASNKDKPPSSSIAIRVIIALVAAMAIVVAFSLSHRGNKEEDGVGSWASVGIKDFNYKTIKIGQPIPSFTVEVASHGTRFCNKPDVYIGKVSEASLQAGITSMGAKYDFKIPVKGHLTANCILDKGGNYTTIWVANSTTTTVTSSITSNNNNTPIVLKETGTYDIVADVKLRHPARARFDVV